MTEMVTNSVFINPDGGTAMAHHIQQAVTRHQITTALSVTTNPAHFCDTPQHFQTAWQTLKAARGESVDFRRIGPAIHQIEAKREPAPLISGMSRGCLDRLRAHVARKGVPLSRAPMPSGGDAA
jgi:hypothetical protein